MYDAVGLHIETKDRTALWHPLTQPVTLLGAHPSCDVWLPHANIQDVHAILYKTASRVLLINRHPQGIWVNKEKVSDDLWLAHFDILNFEDIHITVYIPPKHAGAFKTDPIQQIHRRNPQVPYLLHVHGVDQPQTHPITGLGISVGSAPGNHVHIQADNTVSRTHALFLQQNHSIIVRDLGSTNGVYVDGKRTQECEITQESSVVLGRTHLSIHPDVPPIAPTPSYSLVGCSSHTQHIEALIQSFAPHHAPVLIHGESGTGKEVVAQRLHATSPRASEPMVVLNCGALAHNLIESELFGHEKGSFTGAAQRKAGAFEAANGGTLFLDEIGEMPLALQPQLLRILETGEVRRIGSMKTVQTHVRVIAATHRNLQECVRQGTFREDLFHRLHILNINILPLRERLEDLALLTEHFIQQFSPAAMHITLHPDTHQILMQHPWPGNVRELRNVIQRAVLLRSGPVLHPHDIQFYTSSNTSPEPNTQPVLGHSLSDLEKRAIIQELTRCRGNRTEAAAVLGISRSTMHRKIEEHGIVIPHV
jgi:transcriptional regulator with GAF, ATPase, and Fis domain